MSTSLSITNGFELDFSDNNCVPVAGPEAFRQRLLTNIKFFQGECFLNPSLGVPYFQNVLKRKKGLDIGTLSTIFREAILQTEGTKSIQKLEIDFDGATRVLTVSFRVDATDGTIDESITMGV